MTSEEIAFLSKKELPRFYFRNLFSGLEILLNTRSVWQLEREDK